MRRALVSVVVLTLVASLGPAGRADSYAVRRAKLARAAWLIPAGKPDVYLGWEVFAVVFLDPSSGTAESYAFATKSRCTLSKKRGSTVAVCVALSPNYGYYTPSDADFVVDPALRSATLTLHDERFPRQQVTFTAKGPFGLGYGEETGASSDGHWNQGYFVAKDAKAVGHLFGNTITTTHKLDTAWFGYGPDIQHRPSVTIRGDRAVTRFRLGSR